jgi:hypothetical protein
MRGTGCSGDTDIPVCDRSVSAAHRSSPQLHRHECLCHSAKLAPTAAGSRPQTSRRQTTAARARCGRAPKGARRHGTAASVPPPQRHECLCHSRKHTPIATDSTRCRVSLSPGAAPPSPWPLTKHAVLLPAIRGLFAEGEAKADVVEAVAGVAGEATRDTAVRRVVSPTAPP